MRATVAVRSYGFPDTYPSQPEGKVLGKTVYQPGGPQVSLKNNPLELAVKVSLKKIELWLAGYTRNHRPEKNAGGVPAGPVTRQPVVRDLRYHRFVAHQRERYFLNQGSNH